MSINEKRLWFACAMVFCAMVFFIAGIIIGDLHGTKVTKQVALAQINTDIREAIPEGRTFKVRNVDVKFIPMKDVKLSKQGKVVVRKDVVGVKITGAGDEGVRKVWD